MKKAIVLICSSLWLFSGCSDFHRKITLVKVQELGGAKMVDQPIVDLIREQHGIDLSLQFSSSKESTLASVQDRTVDLAIMPNNIEVGPAASDVKTVISLLPRILIIVYRPDVADNPSSLKDLMNGRTVGFEPMDATDVSFFEEFFRHFGLDQEGDFRSVYLRSDDFDKEIEDNGVEIFITITHLRNKIVSSFLENGGKVFSLDESTLLGSGSNVEGFCLTYPKAYPFIIPKATYAERPEEPVLTIAIRDILICHKSLSDTAVYEIVQTIMENKTRLTQTNRAYGLLDLDYNSTNTSFAFPLHRGSEHYLNKDKPSFFERYADLVGVTFSIAVVLFGATLQIRRMVNQRKKDRIDQYYKELLELKNRQKEGTLPLHELKLQMLRLRDRAFESLVNEKLSADASFTIFLVLFQRIWDESVLNGREDSIAGHQDSTNAQD